MKLHLPASLRNSLLASLSVLMATLGTSNSSASMMRDNSSLVTYTDFGQNLGRYVAGDKANALVEYIRAQDNGGVRVETIQGESYVLEHGMVDFTSAGSAGDPCALVGYNTICTVRHNGVISPLFTDTGIRYNGIEYRDDGTNFRITSNTFDFKITRMSRLVTDVEYTPTYTGSYAAMNGKVLLHTGSGTQLYGNGQVAGDEYWKNVGGAYTFLSGGAAKGQTVGLYGEGYLFTQYYLDQVSADAPLPYLGQAGDSGSAFWAWNDSTGQYEYMGTYALVGGNYGVPTAVGGVELDLACLQRPDTEEFHTLVSLQPQGTTIRIGTEVHEGRTLTDYDANGNIKYQGKERYSVITDSEGNTLGNLDRVQAGMNTWGRLNLVQDSDEWYQYGNQFLNMSDNYKVTDKPLRTDLFLTNDTEFRATGTETYTLELDACVDTGIGYTQFSKQDGVANAQFIIKAKEGTNGIFNTGGFVVDADVSLHLQYTYTADYVREWRKMGSGDLYIDGMGDTNALLNVGGKGKVFLDQQGNGHAAYSVLANTGAMVVLKGGVNQIARDFTFGNGTSYLDFYGHDMEWDNSSATSAAGFHIHAITEEGRITNTLAGRLSTITVKDGGEAFSGAFVDNQGGALRIVYRGAADKVWQLTGIHTDLSHHAADSDGSGFVVENGAVRMGGTNTVHGQGSLGDRTANRYYNEDDWHYADAKMDVTVSGGNFILGSHARLQGTVTVQQSGTFIMEEGVRHAEEYVEGGIHKEKVELYEAFYGLKGDIVNNGKVLVKYGADTDTNNRYTDNVTGFGSMEFDLGLDGGSFTMTGTTSSGKKAVTSGTLLLNSTALGTNGEKWEICDKGVLSIIDSTGGASVLNRIDAESSGVLALAGNCYEQLNLTGHENLIIGAYGEGNVVNYGQANTAEQLQATGGKWRLGGGGGTLVVNYALDDANATLVVGNEYTKGTVVLANSGNHIGHIETAGSVTLVYQDEASLQGADVKLGYASRLQASNTVEAKVTTDSSGVLMMDSREDQAIDMTTKTGVHIGAAQGTTIRGNITAQEGEAYRFGGLSGCTLTVESSLAGNHGLVVDGQTYSGGTVQLNGTTNISGEVTVMGYDATRTDGTTGGDITLATGREDMLATASAVTVKDGGTLDVQGNGQHLQNLNVQSGGTVADSGETSATVTLSGNARVAGSMSVGTLATAQGSTLDITGSVQADHMDATAGGTTTVEQGGTLRLEAATAANERTDLTSVTNHGTVSVAVSTEQLATNVLNLGSGSDGRVVLRSGTLSFQSNLGDSTLVMENGSRLIFGENQGPRNAVFDNDIELAGNAYIRTYGTSKFDSITLTGSITGDHTLTKHDGNQATTFSGKVDLAGMNVQGGTVVLDGDGNDGNRVGTLSVSGNATADIRNTKVNRINLDQAGNISIMNDAADTISTGDVRITAGSKQATMSGSDSTRLEHAAVNMVAGSTLALQDVMLASNSAVYGSGATIQANRMQVEAKVGTNLVQAGEGNLPEGLQMLTYGDNHNLTVQQQESAVQFTLSNLQDVQISGTGLVISLVDGLGHSAISRHDWLAVQLTGASLLGEDLPVWLEYMDQAGTVQSLAGYYTVEDSEAVALAEASAAQHDQVYFRIAGASVPEPASSTLSLLALAALCARRRRK